MKFQRQAQILELIKNFDVETQEDLTLRLRLLGYIATQATISRDIKELRLIKTLSSTGKYKYAVSGSVEPTFIIRLNNIFRECVVSIDCAQNIVVVKTLPGLGSAAASAVDAMNISEIVGSLAGDDTVFIVMRNNENAISFSKTANDLLK